MFELMEKNESTNKKIGTTYNYIKLNSRKILFLAIAIIIWFLCQDAILELYDKNIVTPILSKITEGFSIIAVSIIIFGIIAWCIIYYIKEKTPFQKETVVILSGLLLISLYYRAFNNRYNYLSIGWMPIFKYLDFFILLLATIPTIKLIGLFSSKKEPIYNNIPFLIDAPLRERDSDNFNRRDFAELMAAKIQSKLNKTEKCSLAIGINGVWGSGKTSFMNFIVEKIKEDNKINNDTKSRIIIDFNPWRSTSATKIIEDFFEKLIVEVKKYDSKLSNDLVEYASSLTKIYENKISKGIKSLSEFLFEPETKEDIYDKINSSLSKIKKQIIIFIDDLDRLDKNEIIEVLRLVRNTANFNNVVYIVAYDKEYVLEAVKNFNTHNYNSFLEKIFQFEFSLPSYDSAILRNSLKKGLIEKLGSEFEQNIESAVDYVGSKGGNFTNKIINTKRDVIRLINSILFEYESVKNEVNFIDFYLIQIVKLRFFNIYSELARNKDLYFIRDKKIMRLRKLSEANEEIKDNLFSNINPETDNNDDEGTFLENFVQDEKRSGFQQKDQKLILQIFEDLLIEKELRIGGVSKDYKSFTNWNQFDKYFSYTQLESDFSSSEFEKYRLGNYNFFQNKVEEWIKEGRISDVSDRLKKIIDYETVEEWKNHLKINWYLEKYRFNNGPYGIDYKKIIEIINYPKKVLIFFQNKEEYQQYIETFFNPGVAPCVFESNILATAIKNYILLPISQVWIEEKLFDYLKQYCNSNEEITFNFNNLYQNTIEFLPDPLIIQIQPRAVELYKQYYKSHLKSNKLGNLIIQEVPGNDFFILDNTWITTLFGSQLDFKNYLINETGIDLVRDNEYFKEFLDFHNKLEVNSFKAIPFSFKFLKPQRYNEIS